LNSALPDDSQRLPWRGLAFRIVGAILVFVLLFRFLPVQKVAEALRRVPPALFLVVLAGYLAGHLVGSLKWRMMVNVAGAGLGVAQAMRCYFAGLFGTLFLPSIVGGDVVRAGLALQMGRSKAAVLLGSLLDRILDLVALALLAAVGALLIPGSLSAGSRRVFGVLGAGVLLLAVVGAAILALLPVRRCSYRIRRTLVRLRKAGRSMARRPQYVAASLTLAVLIQGNFIVLTTVIAEAVGLHVAFRAWLFAWPMAKLSAVLPLTQGGIGVREAALAALLVPFGAPAAQTVAVGLAWEGIIIAGGLLAGAASYLTGQHRFQQ